MKPAPFDYIAPGTVEEACTRLAEAGGGATLLAGGQSLMPLLALRMSQPFIVIDLNRIDALRGITRQGAATRIGAMTRQAELIEDSTLATHLGLLVTAARHVGHAQTRTRGTIGGSIAFGDSVAELPATAMALEAVIEVQSIRGTRTIPAAEFYLAPYMTLLEPDEIVTGVLFPDPPEGSLPVFREVAQRPGDFALLGLAGMIAHDGGTVTKASFCWFGMGPRPIRATKAEAALNGHALAALDSQAVAELAVADAEPYDDHQATADYRRTVGRRIFARCLNEALGLKEAA